MSDASTEQASIDAATAVFTQFFTDIEAEVASLEANFPAVDLSGLKAIMATVQAADPGPGATPTS